MIVNISAGLLQKAIPDEAYARLESATDRSRAFLKSALHSD